MTLLIQSQSSVAFYNINLLIELALVVMNKMSKKI